MKPRGSPTLSSAVAPYLETLNLTLTSAQLGLLERHFDLLLNWNRKMNLTAITGPDEIVRRHFAESLFLIHLLVGCTTLADVGSGAGFPGFPIAVALPEVQVTLVESVAKKAAFLKEVARGVPNVRVFHGRFQSLEGRLDCVTLRAVSPESLAPALLQKAGSVLLLTRSSASPPNLPLFTWAPPTPLPWDPTRAALFGVSRGTLPC